MLTKCVNQARQLYEFKMEPEDVKKSGGYTQAHLNSLYFIPASTGPDKTPIEAAVFRIIMVAEDGFSFNAERLDLGGTVHMLMREQQQHQQLTSIHLNALRMISSALGDPFKGNTSKTVIDLAKLAAERITQPCPNCGYRPGERGDTTEEKSAAVTVTPPNEKALPVADDDAHEETDDQSKGLSDKLVELRRVWDRSYGTNAQLTDEEWASGNQLSNLEAGMAGKQHRFVQGGHSGNQFCRLCHKTVLTINHEPPADYDSNER